MPGSHGGGGGGSHSFSSGSHSSHSHQTNYKGSSRSYFPGASRYYYYNHLGARCYFYSNITPTRRSIKSIFFGLFVALFIALCVFGYFVKSTVFTSKLNASYHLTNYVYDNLGAIDDKDGLIDTLDSFYEKTGVQPVVYTQKYDTVKSQYGKYSDSILESYSYDIYNDLFNDEYHWLIVYIDTDAHDNWHWCEIYGDNTSSIITDSLFEALQDELQSSLENQKAIDKSFIDAFTVAKEKALTFDDTKRSSLIVGCIIFGAVLLIITLTTVARYKDFKQVNDYCDYRDKKNNGVDTFEKVDPKEFAIDPNEYKIDDELRKTKK